MLGFAPDRDSLFLLLARRGSDMRSRRGRIAILLLLQCLALPAFAASAPDPTQLTLNACLNDPEHGSTGGQDECEAAALSSYDKRMNVAYSKLIKSLPPQAAQDLKAAQRAWIDYRDLEARARGELFETRQGTMYAPMQADAETDLTRDRTLLLESYLRVLEIDGP
ncbi:lysozyme inhibitor LprI family protein [Rhizobium sp. NPDC090279]|uniref:lysozyme inhibitor LprI family protein n=1 Tax=Rhizobium sp. NPDC090279 TaxID=3364499 RepID=UPI00383A32F2